MKRLVLHAGMTKTGSTALQNWCYKNREWLAGHGVDYPDFKLDSDKERKHQFLASQLHKSKTGDFDEIERRSAADTLLLSTEGLTNHLYDFPEQGLARFREITSRRSTCLFVVTRDSESWLRSYHKQAALNPTRPEYAYGLDAPLETFRRIPRVERMLDSGRVAQDAAAAYGAGRLVMADLAEGWLPALLAMLGIDDAPPEAPGSDNVSVPDGFIALALKVNGAGLPEQARRGALGLMQRCFRTGHTLLGRYDEELADEAKAAADLREILGRGGTRSLEADALLKWLDAR